MERLSLLVDETSRLLSEVSLAARGLYLTLYVLACKKGGDDIETGTPEIDGLEPTPELLSVIHKLPLKVIKSLLKELDNAKLIHLANLKIRQFRKDNEPFLSIRRSNRKRKGMKYNRNSGEIQVNTRRTPGGVQVGKGKEGIGKEEVGGEAVPYDPPDKGGLR